MCAALQFNRMQDLSGFPMKVAVHTGLENIRRNGKVELMRSNYYKTSEDISHVIWNTLKTNVTYVYYDWDDIGEINSSGIPNKYLAKVLRGEFECTGSDDFQHGLWRNELNLLSKRGFCFITQKKTMSIFAQFAKILSIRLFFVFVIFLAAFCALYAFSMKISCLKISLDMVRVLVNHHVLTRPKGRLSKLILIYFLANYFFLSNYLQSHLSAIYSTKWTYSMDIRYPSQLADANYKIYTKDYVAQYYFGTKLDGNIESVQSLKDCFNLMISDPMVACIEDCNWAKRLMEYDFQISMNTSTDTIH